MKYSSRLTALLLALMMLMSSAFADMSTTGLTQKDLKLMYQTASNTLTYEYRDPDVLGFEARFHVDNGEALTAQGYTFQWYSVDMATGVHSELPGETSYAIETVYPMQQTAYYCEYKDKDGQSYKTTAYVLEAQTTDLDEYLGALDILFNEDFGVYDSLKIYEYMTETWNVEIADGVNLAQQVIAHWWAALQPGDRDEDLLCSCVVSGKVAADTCILHPNSEDHDPACFWAKKAVTVSEDVSTPDKLVEGQPITLTSPETDASYFYWQEYRYNAETDKWEWETLPGGGLAQYDLTVNTNTIQAAYRVISNYEDEQYVMTYESLTYYLGGADFHNWIKTTDGILPWLSEEGVTVEQVVAKYLNAADEEERTNATDYTFTEEDGSVNLKVSEGVFTEDYVMEIERVIPSAETVNAVLNSMDATGKAVLQVLKAFDISFASLANPGTKLQPSPGQSVALTFQFDTTGIDEALKYIYVYHIKDGIPEVVAGPVDATQKEIRVDAEAFSVYAVVLSSDSCAYCTEYCVYEELIADMSASQMFAHLEEMDAEARAAYLSAYNLHIAAGEPEVLCNCKDLLTDLTDAGADHVTTCPWHATYSVHTDVVGWEVSLPAPAEATEWVWTDENGNELAENTSDHPVFVKSKPHTYYCVAKVNSETVTYTYYVEAQTTVFAPYVNTLFSYYLSYEELKDYAAFVYNLMTSTDTEDELHWNFEVYDAEGTHLYNMAEAVLSYWYQEDGYDLLCSCIISEAVAPVDGEIMLPWDAEHVEGCPWHIPGESEIEIEPAEYDEDRNVTSYELVVYTEGDGMVVIAKSILMRKDENSNAYHYFQDVNTGWYVAYLHEVANEDGTVTQWIIPLPSEKDLEETPAN